MHDTNEAIYEEACDAYEAEMIRRGYEPSDFDADTWDAHCEAIAVASDVLLNETLARFETLAAGYHCVGNDDAARGIRELIAEIRKDGV